MTTDRNCLSFWFPKIQSTGLPVPRTEIVRTDVNLLSLLDGKIPKGWSDFILELTGSAERIGYPCFLRSGQGSGKHQWRDTCFLESPGGLMEHVSALVEWSELVDFMGLPTDVWAVREMLPTTAQMTCPAYGDFPVCREFRVFVRDGNVVCCHPYWPKKALMQGFLWKSAPKNGVVNLLDEPDGEERELPADFDWRYECLCYLPAGDRPIIESIAESAGHAVGGDYWSVDILETRRGWYLTDMATGERSFHWPECEHAKGVHHDHRP